MSEPLTPTGLAPPPARLASVDAYRGFAMFLMMAEVLHFDRLHEAFPTSEAWKTLAHHQDHVAWAGCSLHDLIQPSFSFLVGVALPFSVASRAAKGQSKGVMVLHAVWRALLLSALGIFLRSVGQKGTNFTFEDTLTQIGLGYTFLFLLGFRPARDQWVALGVILVGYWGAFALYRPGEGFEYPKVGVPADWPHLSSGFASHWNKNANLAWAFDARFLNRFPRASPFVANGGGYATLSFIPTLGTMILGLRAGEWLRRADWTSRRKLATLVVAGLLTLAAGWGLGELGVCPVVKRIWTPSWVLLSGGWCFLLLATFYLVVDLARLKPLAFPLVVIGMNSIAAYCLSHMIVGFLGQSVKTHFGQQVFRTFGSAYEPLVQGTVILTLLWLILFWMYQRRLFLRV